MINNDEYKARFISALRVFLEGVKFQLNHNEIKRAFSFIDDFKVVTSDKGSTKYILFLRKDTDFSLPKGFYPQMYINRIDNKIDIRIRESYSNQCPCAAKDKILAYNRLGVREFSLELFDINNIDDIAMRLMKDIEWFRAIPIEELRILS